ncbi:hypothetical protein [Pediococcus cellicola]|uniref:Integral membrane protein n=1 Tax=Pediococcus cellicola TaxID=319652 RepID=A0A0R2ILV2_9LACO|nr:hypothetical protein [Pediococcus cellicola]KRN66067.1 integral membrane protein [Pediococcus cellicola]GEL15461.1 hypothetical protein PCE01_12630 [Pediococcus cellicola]
MSTRELAIISWIFLIGIFCILDGKLRSSVFGMFETVKELLAQPVFKIILFNQIIILIFFSWKIFQYNLSWWMLKDYSIDFFTILTFLGSYQFIKFRNALFGSLGLSSLFQYLLGNFTFSYCVEMLLIPVLVVLSLIVVVAEQKGFTSVFKFFNEILSIIGMFLIVYVIFRAVISWPQELSVAYWSGFFITAIAWIVNLPLMFLSIPMFQYDVIDNFRNGKKTILEILCQSNLFWLKRFIYGYLFFQKVDQKIVSISQGGLLNRRLVIILKRGTLPKEAKKVEMYYRLLFAKSSNYKQNKKIIPIRIECRNDLDRALIIKPYEISDLQEIYRID